MVPLADRVIELSAHAVDRSRVRRSASPSPPGKTLFRQGEPGDRVYVVEQGEIELVRTLADGSEELLAVAKDGRLLR